MVGILETLGNMIVKEGSKRETNGRLALMSLEKQQQK
jgi:hypothetical protein